MSIALAIAAALAVLCLAYVLYPLIRPRRASALRRKTQTPVTDEEIEATVRAYRAAHAVGTHCAVCGQRPETDAVFCSSCGRRLVSASR